MMRWLAAFMAIMCVCLYAAGGFTAVGLFVLAVAFAIAAERGIDAIVRWWRRK